MTEAVNFVCPRCTSRYKLVCVLAEPGQPSSLIHCRVCKQWLPPTDGEHAWQEHQQLLPWMFQTHIADAKIEQFRTALKAIAALDYNSISFDQAQSTVRQAITIAEVALERNGLAGTRWEQVATHAIDHAANVASIDTNPRSG
jgi:hypothetical protein